MEKQYFVTAVVSYLSGLDSNGEGGFTFDQVKNFIESKYLGKGRTLSSSLNLLHDALADLSELGAIGFFPDKYAGDHFASRSNLPNVIAKLRQSSGPFKSYSAMGRTGDTWLATALRNIEGQTSGVAAGAIQSEPASPDQDHWEPLPLDYKSPDVLEAISGAEKALDAIRSDNGFAAELPGEREDLVAHAEATISAAKSGVVTKSQLRQNLVAAGKWLVDKFGGTAIGTVGGELVKWGLRLLGLIA